MVLPRKIVIDDNKYEHISGVVRWHKPGDNVYLPVDMYDYELNEAIKAIEEYIDSYYIIKVPLLGQYNKKAKATDWCGRASIAMIQNYRFLLNNSNPQEKYLKHWIPAGKNAPELLDADGKYITPALMAGYYEKETDAEAGVKKLFPKCEDRVRKAQRIAKNENLLREHFKPILKSIKSNNPVLMYSGFSKGPCHIIVLCGYVEINGKLWLCVADPEADVNSRFKKGNYPEAVFKNCELTEIENIDDAHKKYNLIILMKGDWGKTLATMRLIRASRFFEPHRKDPKNRLYMDDVGNEGRNFGEFIYSYFDRKVPSEIIESSSSSEVCFPYGKKNENESPVKYFFKNESGKGGFYPVGLNKNIHAGIHLEPGKDEPAPVRCAAPGYIVAARFVSDDKAGNNAVVRKFIGDRDLGFVVVRHEWYVSDKNDEEKKPNPFYSLYMHLAAPDWENKEDVYAKEVKWFAEFQDMRYGGVAVLDPENPDFGKMLWAKESFDEKAAAVAVDEDNKIKIKDGEKILAYPKPAPSDVSEAVAAFKDGSVVTFDKPLLQVKAGDIIGYTKAGKDGKNRYLHWEMFSPAKDSAIQKLLDIDEDIKSVFRPIIKETEHEDNYYDLSEIKSLFEDSNDHPKLMEIWGKKSNFKKDLIKFLNESEAFAAEDKEDAKAEGETDGDDAGETCAPDPFTYPISIKFQNPKNSKESAEVKISFLCEKESVGKKKTIRIDDFSDADFTVRVPAQADTMILESEKFHLETVSLKTDTKSQEVLFMKNLLPYRMRNVIVEHINEWTENGLHKLVDKLCETDAKFPQKLLKAENKNGGEGEELAGEQGREELKKKLRPLVWWNRKKTEEDPFGEVAVIGAKGSSIFNDDILPQASTIHNIHPVTGLWLLDILCDKNKIMVKNEWKEDISLKRDEDTKKLLYFSCIQGDAKMYVAALRKGYGTGESVTIWAETKGENAKKNRIGTVSFENGIACLPVNLAFWGDWKIYPGDNKGTAIESEEIGCDTLSVKKPKFHLMNIMPLQKDSWEYKLLIESSDPWNGTLEGYMAFEYRKAKIGETVEFDESSQLSKHTLLIHAADAGKQVIVKENIEIHDGYVVNKKTKSAKITENFWYSEYLKRFKKDEATPKFRVNYNLCLALQNLRDHAFEKVNKTSFGLHIQEVSSGGDRIFVKPLIRISKNDYRKLNNTEYQSFLSCVNATNEEGVEVKKCEDGAHGPQDVLLSIIPMSGCRLAATFDPSSVIQEISDECNLSEGEQVIVRPSLLIPNGGHISDSTGNIPELSVSEVRKQCAEDLMECKTAFTFPPVEFFGYGKMSWRIGRSKLYLDIQLNGDKQMWKDAGVIIKASDDKVCEDEELKDGMITVSRGFEGESTWGKELKFTTAVKNPSKLPFVPKPKELTYKFMPTVVFNDIVDNEGTLHFSAEGNAIPTGKDFQIIVEKYIDGEWVDDSGVKKEIEYGIVGRDKSGTLVFGRFDSVGVFKAELDKDVLKDKYQRRFTLERSWGGEILKEVVKIEGKSKVYTPAKEELPDISSEEGAETVHDRG